LYFWHGCGTVQPVANHKLIEFGAWPDGTARLWATLEGAAGWQVIMDLVTVDGSAVIAGLSVCPATRSKEVSLGDGLVGYVPTDEEPLAPGDIPAGGLSARQLRRVNPGELLDIARRAARGRAGEVDPIIERFTAADRSDIAAQLQSESKAAGAFVAPSSRPGRKGHGLVFYAVWAARYADLVSDGSETPSRRPHRVLADRYASEGFSESAIRGIVNDARHRHRLLTPAAVRGRPGGQLTEKAKAVLAELEKGSK
jgi:hypothetical protein